MSAHITYIHDGDPRTIDFDFLNPMHVQVWVNGVQHPKIRLPDNKKLDLPNVAAGSMVSVQRYTPLTDILPYSEEREKSFKIDGAKFRAINYKFEEIESQLRMTPLITTHGISMRGEPIKDCGTPKEESDATSMSWVKTYVAQAFGVFKGQLRDEIAVVKAEVKEEVAAVTARIEYESNKVGELLAEKMHTLRTIQKNIEGQHDAVKILVDRLFALSETTSGHASTAKDNRLEAQGVVTHLKDAFQDYYLNLSKTHGLVKIDFTEHHGALEKVTDEKFASIEQRLQTLEQNAQNKLDQLEARSLEVVNDIGLRAAAIDTKTEEAKASLVAASKDSIADIVATAEKGCESIIEREQEAVSSIKDIGQKLEEATEKKRKDIETTAQISQQILEEVRDISKQDIELSTKISKAVLKGSSEKSKAEIEFFAQKAKKALEEIRDSNKLEAENSEENLREIVEEARSTIVEFALARETFLEDEAIIAKKNLEEIREKSKAAIEAAAQRVAETLKKTGSDEREAIERHFNTKSIDFLEYAFEYICRDPGSDTCTSFLHDFVAQGVFEGDTADAFRTFLKEQKKTTPKPPDDL